jgi:hypothetical protein
MKELHTISFQTKLVQAEALVKSAQAEAEAEVTAARRKVELEHQTTQTEIAKHAAERELIDAQAKAQAARLAGLTEAGEVIEAAADFNGDGRINARDARAILRHVAGLDS